MKITEEQLDTIKELFNIGVGRAANTLSTMLNSFIQLEIPTVEIYTNPDYSELKKRLNLDQVSTIMMDYESTFSGSVFLMIPPESATNLVSALVNEEPGPISLDPVRAGTLCEVGNMIINSLMGSFSNVLQETVNYSLPEYKESTFENILLEKSEQKETSICIANTTMKIQELEIRGNLIIVFKVGHLEKLLASIDAI
ncbi:MAG: chemotaxis protein CheC [Nitrospina sp.]|jgi:chemotaxis protein CheC|nr:chemotaxis protein CheC [Nitrospina sp.]MBT5633907.1 chemotaxis protein CheC [Nitrospina sp.]